MAIAAVLRSQLKRLMVGRAEIALERKAPVLSERLLGIGEFGLYLHIPFCRQICPYCPYNKELYDAEVAQRAVELFARGYAAQVRDRDSEASWQAYAAAFARMTSEMERQLDERGYYVPFGPARLVLARKVDKA